MDGIVFSIHFLDLQAGNVNAIESAHIDRRHRPLLACQLVDDSYAAGVTEGMSGDLGPKIVTMQVFLALNLNFVLGRVDPEVGVARADTAVALARLGEGFALDAVGHFAAVAAATIFGGSIFGRGFGRRGRLVRGLERSTVERPDFQVLYVDSFERADLGILIKSLVCANLICCTDIDTD